MFRMICGWLATKCSSVELELLVSPCSRVGTAAGQHGSLMQKLRCTRSMWALNYNSVSRQLWGVTAA